MAPDPTWAEPGEGTLAWLRRSTLPRAGAARAFLNDQLSRLPPAIAEHLFRRLSSHWESSFFELIVARTLQELGADLGIELPNEEGFCPDYRARFDDSVVTVEAIVPAIGRDVMEQRRRADALSPILQAVVPPAWSVLLEELPPVGPSESKQELKRVVARAMPTDSPVGPEDWREIEARLSTGRLAFTLLPRAGKQAIVGGPVFSGWDDSEERIRVAVRRKRRQVRSEDVPVLLAICAAGMSSDFEAFDGALFGRSCAVIRLPGRQHLRTEFRRDGLFMKRRDRPPTYAGVLAYLGVGFICPTDPVLYIHPRFDGVLPERILALERRFASSDGIAVTPARQPGFLRRIGFVEVAG